jgi:hypothetical protein
MSYFIDISYDSVNKYGEELCGDNVEIFQNEESTFIVLADGLGSGVKANILATMTSKMAGTMLRDGVSIEETVDTITNTLPVCSVRKLAYSTFGIIQISKDSKCHIIEYDNPPVFVIRNGEILDIEKKDHILNGRLIKESFFDIELDDVLVLVSDGVIHAGVGAILNLGWQWENVADYLVKNVTKEKCAENISKGLLDVCKCLYENKPGDDTTVAAVKIREPEIIDLFTGPPVDPDNDSVLVEQFMRDKGKKIVCGGTAAKIISRELNREMEINLDYINPKVPPTAKIKGIDLVTEGVLTLSRAIDVIKEYCNVESEEVVTLKEKDGATVLAKMLIEDCTHLNLRIGKAVNPAHQNPDFPIDLSIKLKVVDNLIRVVRELGKIVNVYYY